MSAYALPSTLDELRVAIERHTGAFRALSDMARANALNAQCSVPPYDTALRLSEFCASAQEFSDLVTKLSEENPPPPV